MRCYKVEAVGPDKEILATRYGSTAANAKEWKTKLIEILEVKRDAVTIEELEIPMDKPGLLGYFNTLLKDLDDPMTEGEHDVPDSLEPPPKAAAKKAPAKKASKK